MHFTIKAENISKRFGLYTVFRDINFSLDVSKSLSVTGPNGSGKSTLLEIIAGIKNPTSGKLTYTNDNKKLEYADIKKHIGFSSPRINPYFELTAVENLQFVYGRGRTSDDSHEYINDLLNRFNLYSDRNKRVKYFSTGMMQRLRIIAAILNDPYILILDEPGSNLDETGRKAVYSYIESINGKRIVIIATNEKEEAGISNVRLALEK